MGDRKRPRDEETELKRVAEMVMVLSALSQLRAGAGDPTPAEVSLVAEARKRLAAVCEVVRPKDLFSSEAVRALVLDLGLNGSSDPLRPPRISINDKVLHAKKKMEEIKDIPAHSSIYSTQNFLNAESPGTLYGNTRFHGALPVPQIPVTSASLKQQGSAVLHQTGQSPMVLQSQGATASFTFDGRTPIRGNENLPQRSITASYMHSPFALASTSAAKIGETNVPNQLHDHTPLKAESSSNMTQQSSHQLSRNYDTKVAVQAGAENLPSGHHPTQGLVLGNASTAFPDHNNIVQKVQNFLQGKAAVNPTWDPPSTKYIDEPLDCQICKFKVGDDNNVLVCDACEKGNHLKCLQLYGNKNIPKQDWYCARCLTSNHGKPLPPKYGHVTRTPPAAQNVKPKKIDKPKTQSTQQGASVLLNGNPGVVQKTNSDKNGATSCDLVNDPRINGTQDESGTDLSVTGKEQPICTTTEHLHLDKKDHALCTTPVQKFALAKVEIMKDYQDYLLLT